MTLCVRLTDCLSAFHCADFCVRWAEDKFPPMMVNKDLIYSMTLGCKVKKPKGIERVICDSKFGGFKHI